MEWLGLWWLSGYLWAVRRGVGVCAGNLSGMSVGMMFILSIIYGFTPVLLGFEE